MRVGWVPTFLLGLVGIVFNLHLFDMELPLSKAVLFLIIFISWTRISVLGFTRCPGSPEANYLGGTMDCTVPHWTFGRFLHEINFPSWYPEMFYKFTKDGVRSVFCRTGTCFMFARQECVAAAVWRSDCNLQEEPQGLIPFVK